MAAPWIASVLLHYPLEARLELLGFELTTETIHSWGFRNGKAIGPHFNHKGGVSKTTTVYNVGWMLAEQGHRVLLVDADPQCNLSSLILGDDFDAYYLDDATRLQNIKDGVAPAFKPAPIQPVICKCPARQPRVYLLAAPCDFPSTTRH